jgi:signal transduction histidine kinase
MPDGAGRCSEQVRLCRRDGRWVVFVLLALSLAPQASAAEPMVGRAVGGGHFLTAGRLAPHELVALALILGAIVFAVVTAVALVRTRHRAALRDSEARAEIASLHTDVDRLAALVMSEPQVLVIWTAGVAEPEVIGDVSCIVPEMPNHAPQRLLAFGDWLGPDFAQSINGAIDRLKSQGEAFALQLATLSGRYVEADGRAMGGFAVTKLRDVTGTKREVAELSARSQRLQNELDALRNLIEALPSPIWLRDAGERLVLVNSAFARAVEAPDPAMVVAKGIELLGAAEREEISRRAAAGGFHGRLPAIVAGSRRMMDVIELPTARGRVGMGIDASEAERLRVELARMLDAHRRTLDQLATGVAIFDADRKLTFHNAAYRALWTLDPAFLEEGPSDGQILDRLRAARRLPEERDFHQWKANLHKAYQSTETERHEWHLPDRRTLRVVTTPNPEGGVTYLFDDITERLELERRFDSLIRVQGETLDNLSEGVAVFGSDGRLRLFNPAFLQQWRIDAATLGDRPHIEAVISRCMPLHRDGRTWNALRGAVTALDKRDPIAERIERSDGSVVDFATVPLPDGATLVTFQDVTDSVNVERALRERNEALIAADEMKLDFVHHVSYELRSPLTNIIGFAHFLGDPSTGPLNEKQAEYLTYITTSTNALLAIINNILDLATIDAGAMTLNLGPVDIRETMEAAAEGVQDRLVKDGIVLDLRADPEIGAFVGDGRRIRQVLFNLLSNAIGFSPPGGLVTLTATRSDAAIIFSVSDQGPGIAADMTSRVFELFETDSRGSDHRGAGLGLSIVRSFVELHGGKVRIESGIGHGTTVVCTFPLPSAAAQTAAE